MNIGFVSSRLAGTDGVSLEAAKLAAVLRKMGHDIYYCAGELDGDVPGVLAPELHFTDETAAAFVERAFGKGGLDKGLLQAIGERAQELRRPLQQFITQYDIHFLIVQNAFAIPMQLPLAQALTELLAETGLPALTHNHDFYWERPRYQKHCLGDFLDSYFPPNLPNLHQAVINSAAQRSLLARQGVESFVLPNVFDFETPAPEIDEYNADFRQAIGLEPEDWLFLQPTRVIPRKGIELALEFLARLNDPRVRMVITHQAGDEGLAYWQSLQALAADLGVDLRLVADVVGDKRGQTADGRKIYSLWDAYPHADFVTYTSLIEGFGNALLETIYFRQPALVNRYPVYQEDIGPLGFDFVEIDGAVTPEAVTAVKELRNRPQRISSIAEHNYQLALAHFSYRTLHRLLLPLFT